MTPSQIRILIYLAVGVVAFIGFRMWLADRDEQLATESTAAQGVRTSAATSGIAHDAGVAGQGAQDDITGLAAARDAYQRGYTDAVRNDPVVRDLGAQPIPQRMRDLARERREARERLGRDGDGGGGDGGGEGARR